MFRSSAILAILLLCLASASGFAQAQAEDRGWLEQELIRIEVFPFKDKAYQYLKEGKGAKAAAEFAKVLNIDPADSGARLDYCQVLHDLGRYAESAQQASAVLRGSPANVQALMLGADSLQKLGRYAEALESLLAALDRGRLDRTEAAEVFLAAVNLLIRQQDYDRVLALVGPDTQTLSPARKSYLLGLAYKGAGRSAEARSAYEQALAVTGKAALSAQERLVALSDLADLLIRAGEAEAARERLLAAHAIDPSSASIAYRLASLAYESGRYDHALIWLDRSMQSGRTAKQKLLKALIFAASGRGEQALRIFDDLVEGAESEKDRAQLLMQQGHVAAQLGRHDRAARCFARAAVMVPDVAALRALATAQSAGGRWAEAADSYRLLLARQESGADRAGTRLQLATALMKDGRTAKAVGEFNKALQSGQLSASDRLKALQNLGFLHYDRRAYRAAEQAFAALLAEQPDSRRVLLALSRTQMRLGEYAKAVGGLRRLVAQKPASEVFMLLADAYEKDGRPRKAVETYRSLLDSGLARGDQAAAVLERIATFESRQGRPDRAAAFYAQAYRMAEQKDPSLLLRAGESFLAARQPGQALRILQRYLDNPRSAFAFDAVRMMGSMLAEQQRLDEAAALYRQALKRNDFSPEQRGRLLVSLGYLAFAEHRTRAGVDFMHRAIAVGGETAQIRLDIGMALYRAGHYLEAIKELQRAKELGAGHEAGKALAFCYDRFNKPGLALYHMKGSERTAPAAVLESSAELYDHLAYLYLSEGSFPQAVASYRKAMRIAPAPLRAYGLGRGQRLLGDLESAQKTLLAVNPMTLDKDIRAQYYEELGRVAKGLGHFARAQEYYRQALAVESSSERHYLLGQARQAAGDLAGAIDAYLRAYEMDGYDMYALSLGYAYYRHGDLEKAAAVFEDLQSRDPDYIRLVEDLAYLNKRLYRNRASVDWFTKAINNEPFYPDETAQSLRQKIYGFKEEMRSLTNRWDITGFYSCSPGNAGYTTDAQGVRVGVLDNSAGVEVGYIPEHFGFRNGKIFQVISRVSIGREDDGPFSFDAETLQGAVGVRYKPFSAVNFSIGAERLFKIGDKAEHNTLLRAMGSWDDGWTMRAAERQWNYSFLFGEIDHYVEDQQRTVYIAHARQGRSFNVNDAWLISPHVYATYKHISPDRNQTGHFEGGPAISVRWLEGEDENVSYKREWEALVRYSFGTYHKGDDKTFSGLSINLRLNF